MREMAKGDGSTELTFNLHATIITILAHLGTPAQQERYLGTVVRRDALEVHASSVDRAPDRPGKDVGNQPGEVSFGRDGDWGDDLALRVCGGEGC
jgi:alkylation response protein AidB-like acyl-CoA dehydrogenase